MQLNNVQSKIYTLLKHSSKKAESLGSQRICFKHGMLNTKKVEGREIKTVRAEANTIEIKQYNRESNKIKIRFFIKTDKIDRPF